MKLEINNTTGCLNDYFFQMLCLLYFPGEKFSNHSVDEASPDVSFDISGADGEYECHCTVSVNNRRISHSAKVEGSSLLGNTGDESAAQICAGRAFIACCKEIFGFVPPWGQMTGLRPVKRALYYLDRGRDEAYTKSIFTSDFSVSDEKAGLCTEIALRQQGIMRDIGANDCAMYVAIPFCPSRCSYCSFVSYSGKKLFALLDSYLVRLKTDITRTAALLKRSGLRLVSLYIGGGTPTILDETQLESLLSHLTSCVDMSLLREFTLEGGRPDTITAGKLDIAERYGVTRISINTQTTDDNILRTIGRAHSAKDFFDAYAIAGGRRLSVNTDLIAGLPGDSREGFAKTLSDVISCRPDNITVHTMSVKNAAPIRFDVEGVYDPEGACANDCVASARRILAGEGFFPYYLYRQKNTVGNAENCGYAKPGTECLYNIMTMEERNSIFACGASALTKIVSGERIERFAFPKYPFEYLKEDNGVFEKEIIAFLAAD